MTIYHYKDVTMDTVKKKPGLFSAVSIGVGSMIGSGWLFSAYYAARYIGPASFFSWAIGAVLALVLALLLAEIAGIFQDKALFTRLITISHKNADFGFVVAISGWLSLVLVIPTEASATVQYLSTSIPSLTSHLMAYQHHTPLGTACIIGLVIVYSLFNFWGMRAFSRVSNMLAVFKIMVPVITALLLITASFHVSNFFSQGFMPYGAKTIFSGVVVCGIFYTFYGFSLVAMYGPDLENPQKNIPRALILSVLICFVIYSLLQAAFIGSLPVNMVAEGWSRLNFTSPFAQLLLLLDIHLLSIWAIALYFDSTVSPSGTAIICLNSAAKTLTGMAEDHQLPYYFNKIDPVFQISYRSLMFTTFMCCLTLLFFKNWQELMILVSVFQLISCASIPISFTRLRIINADLKRIYNVKMGNVLSYLMFMVLSYFLIKVDLFSLAMALILYVIFFTVYVFSYYHCNITRVVNACCSSWSIFLYMSLTCFLGYLNQHVTLENRVFFFIFSLLMSLNFWLMIRQKNYN